MHIVHATVDGVTLVTDTAKAFDRLPAENKKYLLTHGFFAPETGVAHPIVRPHPLTGRIGFYYRFRSV